MGSPALIEGTFSKVPDDSWRDRLTEARAKMIKRTVPAFIEFCREVHAFREDCDATQGGSEFSRKGCEWLGCDSGTLHKWDAVGRRAGQLEGAPQSLPASEDSICRIAQLDDIRFQKALPKLKPDMPQKEVRELIKELEPPKVLTDTDLDDKARRTRERLYKQFEALPEKHRFVLAGAIVDYAKLRGWEL